MKDLADKFVRVRLTRIDQSDLGLFQFDYDLTLMIFFMSADEKIYGRYGGRDETGPDNRQSLAGLRYAMQAALRAHDAHDFSPALQQRGERTLIRDLPAARNYRGCIHCHEAKEILYDSSSTDHKLQPEAIWRYPLPDNLGFVLDVDRGNVVSRVVAESAADRAGLREGDELRQLNSMPVHSLADAQFALDRAPRSGLLEVRWQRLGRAMNGRIELEEGWRRSDLLWRPSMRYMVPSARVFGRDLTPEERKEYGLLPDQLAFWQKFPVSNQAADAGIREDDIILGFDGQVLKMEAYDFLRHVESNYLVGDLVLVDVIRDRQRIQIPMKLR